MAKLQTTWVIKNKKGQIKGPYQTEALLKMIADGVLEGDELVASLPGNHWRALSKQPEFYDYLLQTIEKQNKPTLPETAKSILPETVIVDHNTNKPKDILADKALKVKNPEGHKSQKQTQNMETIELATIESVSGKDYIKNNSKLFIAVIGILIFIGIIFIQTDESENNENKIRLLAPRMSGQTALSIPEIKSIYSAALSDISQDTYESYIQAQNKLVKLIEGSPQNLEMRALLCLTYKELWPISFQDATDIKTLTHFAQSTRAINLASPYGQICEIVRLLSLGRYSEARGLIDLTLDGDIFSLSGVVNQFKGEMLDLFAESNFAITESYLKTSIQSWPSWLKPQRQQADVLFKMNRNAEGIAILKNILKQNPNHMQARIKLGLILKKVSSSNPESLSLLISAVDSKARLDRLLEIQAYIEITDILMAQGEKSKALQYAKEGHKKHPLNKSLKDFVVRLGGDLEINKNFNNNEMMFLGDQYARQGKHLDAQAEYKAAFELDPKNAIAAYRAAKSLWMINQSYEAIDWLQKSIKADPKYIPAYILQADYLTQRYDFLKATQILQKAVQINPQNHEVFKGMALLELRKNNLAGAAQYALRALKIYEADVEVYSILSEANAGLAASMTVFNKKDIEKKEAAQRDAIRYATRGIELDATNSDAQIIYAKIIAQFNGVEQGLIYLRQQEDKYSYTLSYKLAIADIYASQDRFNEALTKYQQVADLDPQNKKALLGVGNSYQALGLMDKALRAFFTAAAVDPSDPEALFLAGKVYYETHRYEDAIKQFERVKRINPLHPRTDFFIGKSAFAQNDFSKALSAVELEKKQNPNLADPYILAAEILYSRKQYTECASEYAMAMKLRPQGAEIYVKAAQCYRLSGAVEVAEDMLALALERENGYADIYKEQGAIFEFKGDVRAAVQAYSKYLGLSPNALDRNDIENRIRQLGGP